MTVESGWLLNNPMIGLFDSGLGGLSVLAAVREQMPLVDLIYVADQGRAPYGDRPQSEVREFSIELTDFLIKSGAELVTIACNTASAAALHHLRNIRSTTAFVGLEPAVKPAAEISRSGTIAVLGTTGTINGPLLDNVIHRYADDTNVISIALPGLVELIESGLADSPQVDDLLEKEVRPALKMGADALVLGCTHYTFVAPTLSKIAGPNVKIIDPAAGVARQVERRYQPKNDSGSMRLLTTGDPVRFHHQLREVLGWNAATEHLKLSALGK